MMQANRAHMVTYFRYFDSDGAYKQFYDYQGNVRSVVTGWDAQDILSTDYYPYGIPMATSTGANPIKYIDPSGETIIAYDGDKRIWFGYRNGDLVVTDDDGNQIDYNDPIRIAYDNVTIGNTYFTYSPLPIYVISSYWISKILNSK